MRVTKSHLLGSTALVAAGTLAGGTAFAEAMNPSISVSGYFAHDTHFANQDLDENKGSIAHHVDSEVFFNFGGEMENGIKIGGRVELEALQAGDQIDETFLDISGAWGMIRVGMSNSGRYYDSWTVGGPNVGYGVSSGVTTEWLELPDGVGAGYMFRRPLGSAHPDVSNDDPIVTYYTPRFNGFRFTASHRPTVQGGGSGGQAVGFADEASEYTDAIDVSATYAGDIGGVAVALAGGVASASAPNSGGMCGDDDYQSVNGGVRVSMMGFSVGGHMTNVDNEKFCGSGTAMHVGASYGQGPWAISVTAHDGEVELSPADGDATMTSWALGARYVLGPGVRLTAAFQDAEITSDTGASNSGQAFTAGFRVGF